MVKLDKRTQDLVGALFVLFMIVVVVVAIFVAISMIPQGTAEIDVGRIKTLTYVLLSLCIFSFIGGLSCGYSFGRLRYLSPPPPPSTRIEEKKYCRYCGTENKSDASYREKCGKSLR